MPASVLKSKRAVQVNIAIMRTFVRLREILTDQVVQAHPWMKVLWIDSTRISINRHERIVGDQHDQPRAERASDQPALVIGGGGLLHGDHAV